MAKENFQDLVKDEVDAIEALIIKSIDELNEVMDKIDKYMARQAFIADKIRLLKINLTDAKKQAGMLKKFVWTSDNPNIVELRNELLLVAKLTKDLDTTKK